MYHKNVHVDTDSVDELQKAGYVFKYVNGLISNISKDNRIVVEVVYAQVAYREK